ncbi:MAG: hypothetical protein QNJ17_14215 [Desulfocapsaceae bacterium]|nr:hypothetical protein [Desulfocapsaceae bacterium]
MDTANKLTDRTVKAKKKLIKELLIIFILCVIVFLFAAYFDILEKIVAFSQAHEEWEIDEIVTTAIFFSFALMIFSIRRWIEYRKALQEIKRLQGILPICSVCKKIRDDAGYWHQIESYIHDHSEVEFSHSICQDCHEKLYPDFVRPEKRENQPS